MAGTEGGDWKFSQCFGDKAAAEVDDLTDADILSAVEFDQSGDYLATGDKGGRIVIFHRDNAAAASSMGYKKPGGKLGEYSFYTEFQSHEPEFDYLKVRKRPPRTCCVLAAIAAATQRSSSVRARARAWHFAAAGHQCRRERTTSVPSGCPPNPYAPPCVCHRPPARLCGADGRHSGWHTAAAACFCSHDNGKGNDF